MSEMKKCSQCEAELPDDAVFCPECGTRQAAQPPAETAGSGMQGSSAALVGAAAIATGNAAAFDPFAANPSPVTSATTSPTKTSPATASPTSASTAAAQSFQYAMPTPPPEVPQQPAYPQPMQPQAGQASWTQQQTPPSPQGWQQPPAGIMPAPATQPPANAGGFGKKKVKPEPVAPAAAPVAPTMEKAPAKLPVATLIILGLTFIGLLVWFLMYNSPKLPVFAFSAATANGVVFSFLLMTILAIVGAALFRFNMRGRKLAVLGDILLVIVLLVLFYGLSVTMFKDTNLFYRMFIAITGG